MSELLKVVWDLLVTIYFSEFRHKSPYAGYFNFLTPYLLIIDPELAKQIMIKDFKNFRNNEFSSLVS